MCLCSELISEKYWCSEDFLLITLNIVSIPIFLEISTINLVSFRCTFHNCFICFGQYYITNSYCIRPIVRYLIFSGHSMSELFKCNQCCSSYVPFGVSASSPMSVKSWICCHGSVCSPLDRANLHCSLSGDQGDILTSSACYTEVFSRLGVASKSQGNILSWLLFL